VLELVEESEPPPHWFVFDAEATGDIDITASEMLHGLIDELQSRDIVFVIAEPNGRTRESLRAGGLEAKLGPERIFPTIDTAVRAFADWHADTQEPAPSVVLEHDGH